LAIGGLTKLKARQAVGAWIALLDDPDIAVRVNAIQALGEIGDPRARDPLIPFLGDLFDHAAVALRKLGETETVEIIERVLQRDASALERLRANGPPETAKLNALGRALGFRACAANAAWALDSLGEVWVIISALDEPDPTAVNAARELGNLGRVEGLPRLRSKSGLFRTTSAELKEVCCEAIAKLEKLAALPRSTSSPAASDLSSLPRPAAPKTVDPATLPRAAEP